MMSSNPEFIENAKSIWRLSAIQLTSEPEPENNFSRIDSLLARLPKFGQHLVVLPECFAVFGGPATLQQHYQAPLGQGELQQRTAALARAHQVFLLAGSMPTTSPDPSRFYASSILFSPTGEILADYQKLHLFDVTVSDNTSNYCESASTMPGNKVTLFEHGSLKLGLTICYDVRFPGLSQLLAARGMNVLAVPAAFTRPTGEAHWYALLSARAIENQCFVIAPGQTGIHANGRETYGHSVIIDPWGNKLADAGTAEGVISIEVDLADCQRLASKMPVKCHNRFISELK